MKTKTIEETLDQDISCSLSLGYFDFNSAIIALANELGLNNRPARPFIRPVLLSPEFKVLQEREFSSFLAGEQTKEQALENIGKGFKKLLEAYIRNSDNFEKNAVATVDKKGVDTPLLVNGESILITNFEARTSK